jgi:hypothetical protein
MRTGRPKKPVILSDQEHEQLTSIVRSRSLPHGLVTRAQIVLMAAEGVISNEIAKKVGLSRESRAFTTSCVQVGLDLSRMNKWPP